MTPEEKRSPAGPLDLHAVVLVGHGAVPRDYPRDRLARLRALEGSRRAAGSLPSREEIALETELRHWPRTAETDPYQAGLRVVAAHLEAQLHPVRLALAYNEFCAPTVADTIRALVREGVRDIIVVPSMLTPGGVHAEIDIPRTIEALRTEFTHVRLRYAWPFAGEHVAAFFHDQLRRFEAP